MVAEEDGNNSDEEAATPASSRGRPPKQENPENNDNMPSVSQVCETFNLVDVEIEYNDSDFQTITTYKLFQNVIRPIVSKENPKVSHYSGYSQVPIYHFYVGFLFLLLKKMEEFLFKFAFSLAFLAK